MSAKKSISNTFTVNTIIDGESAPYYFQEWFAWSNDASTSSVTTPPTISGSWATSIPAQGSYAYLWRKSIRYVWQDATRTYSAEAAQYFRMSGLDGTSIKTRGQVANASSRGNGTATIITDSGTQTITLLDGDAVTQLDNGHLYQWVTEGGGKWLDLGQFKGESGVTYYTHIAWAEFVDDSFSPILVQGFVTSKSPNDTTHPWMGTYIDTNSGQDSSNKSLYVWSNSKGDTGDKGSDAVTYALIPSVNVVTKDQYGVPVLDVVMFSLYKTIGTSAPTVYNRISDWNNQKFHLFCVVNGQETEVTYNYMETQGIYVNYHDIESLYEQNDDVVWLVKENQTIITQLVLGVVNNGTDGDNGEDAFRCSIDNQHEDFLYNDDGTLISPSGGATSQAMLYQGERNMTPMANWLISSDGGSTWASSVTGTVTASIVTSGTNIGKLTVLGFSGASAKVLVRAEYPATNGTFYYAEFTANKTSQDKYDLIISPNSIAYNPATYVTQQVSVSAKRTDFQGNTTSVPISLQENVGKLRLFTAAVLQDGTHTQLSQIDELPLFVNEIIADNFVGMYIELRKYVNPNGSNASSNVVVDYQTIPITKAENGEDGEDGEDAVVYKISLAGSVFSVDPNQSGGLMHFNINGAVYKTVGGTTSIYTELTEHLLTLSTISSDGQETTLSIGDYSVSNGEFTSTVYEGTGYNDESIFLAVLTIGNREVARESIQIERYGENGQTGQRGKIGRFLYFGGTFDSSNNSLRYTVNDAQAPYFEHTENGQKRYHVFNYETNGSYTMSQMWAISSNWNNKPWESMTNDFKYIITEATFSQFAHLGSFIISKDYFISQYGTLFYNNNGAIETTVINASNVSTLFGGSVAYAWFADSDPMAGTMPTVGNYKFRPTKCMDALSGDEWMAGGNIAVKGNGDVDIIGTIRAKNLYHNVCLVPAAGEYSNDVYYVYDNTHDDFWEEHPEYHIGDYITIPHNTTLPNGIHPCTYDADVVVMIPNNINWEWPSNGNICYLPKPSDFVGKIVEVNMQGSCGENGKIMCVDSSQNYFIHSPRFEDQTIVDADTHGPYAFSTVYLRFSVQAYQIPAGGGTYQSIGWREIGGKRVLYSDGSHWITIE